MEQVKTIKGMVTNMYFKPTNYYVDAAIEILNKELKKKYKYQKRVRNRQALKKRRK
jgi:hypothetical protein